MKTAIILAIDLGKYKSVARLPARREYAEQVRARLERQLRRRAKEMGYELKKIEAPPADAPPAG